MAASRFARVSDEEISEMKINAVPKSTQSATKYGVKLFKDLLHSGQHQRKLWQWTLGSGCYFTACLDFPTKLSLLLSSTLQHRISRTTSSLATHLYGLSSFMEHAVFVESKFTCKHENAYQHFIAVLCTYKWLTSGSLLAASFWLNFLREPGTTLTTSMTSWGWLRWSMHRCGFAAVFYRNISTNICWLCLCSLPLIKTLRETARNQ